MYTRVVAHLFKPLIPKRCIIDTNMQFFEELHDSLLKLYLVQCADPTSECSQKHDGFDVRIFLFLWYLLLTSAEENVGANIHTLLKFKVAPYGSAYFWTFQRYDYVNEYIIFFSTRHENRTALEYLEAILDNVSVTIAT